MGKEEERTAGGKGKVMGGRRKWKGSDGMKEERRTENRGNGRKGGRWKGTKNRRQERRRMNDRKRHLEN
jgi:hypothetical protein